MTYLLYAILGEDFYLVQDIVFGANVSDDGTASVVVTNEDTVEDSVLRNTNILGFTSAEMRSRMTLVSVVTLTRFLLVHEFIVNNSPVRELRRPVFTTEC